MIPSYADVAALIDALGKMKADGDGATEFIEQARAGYPSVGRYYGQAQVGTPEHQLFLDGTEAYEAREADHAARMTDLLASVEPTARSLARLFDEPATVVVGEQGRTGASSPDLRRNAAEWTGYHNLGEQIAAIKLAAPAARSAIAATLEQLRVARVNDPALSEQLEEMDGQIERLLTAAEASRDVEADLVSVSATLHRIVSIMDGGADYVLSSTTLVIGIVAIVGLMFGQPVLGALVGGAVSGLVKKTRKSRRSCPGRPEN